MGARPLGRPKELQDLFRRADNLRKLALEGSLSECEYCKCLYKQEVCPNCGAPRTAQTETENQKPKPMHRPRGPRYVRE